MSNTVIPFNEWSKTRIKEGRKICTSRNKRYPNDPRLIKINGKPLILALPLGTVKWCLWKEEGDDSPEEFEEVWNSIHPKRKFDPSQIVHVHFGDFQKEA